MLDKDSVLLVDTSILIDCFKFQGRNDHFEGLAKQCKWTFTTDIALLEFKAVLIQQMITIHANLVRLKRFTLARFRMLESTHPQVKLRAHIFNNFINVHAKLPFDIGEAEDLRLGEEARLCLEPQIRWVYKQFNRKVASVQKKIACDRAVEPPTKQRTTYNPNLPVCKRDVNKTCHVETFFRQSVAPKAPQILEAAAGMAEPDQLVKACDLTNKVVKEPNIDLSSCHCRTGGDCLITIAGEGLATHAISTNKRDWEPLAGINGMSFVPVEYPDRAKKQP